MHLKHGRPGAKLFRFGRELFRLEFARENVVGFETVHDVSASDRGMIDYAFSICGFYGAKKPNVTSRNLFGASWYFPSNLTFLVGFKTAVLTNQANPNCRIYAACRMQPAGM
jgi:hypothetical protein